MPKRKDFLMVAIASGCTWLLMQWMGAAEAAHAADRPGPQLVSLQIRELENSDTFTLVRAWSDGTVEMKGPNSGILARWTKPELPIVFSEPGKISQWMAVAD